MLTRAEIDAAEALVFSLPRIADALEKIANGLDALTAGNHPLKTDEELTEEQREKEKG